jgi:hypothetical protein
MSEAKVVGGQLEKGVTNWTPATFKRDAAAAVPAKVQRVHCPYCMHGGADVVVTGNGNDATADIKPKQCSSCFQWFRIGYRIQFVGVRMEGG